MNILSVAAVCNWPIHIADVKSTFVFCTFVKVNIFAILDMNRELKGESLLSLIK